MTQEELQARLASGELEDVTDQVMAGVSPGSGLEDVTDQVLSGKVGRGGTLRDLIGRESDYHYGKVVGGSIDNSIRFSTLSDLRKKYGNKALGRYQIQSNTAYNALKKRGIRPDTYVYSDENQERLFDMLLQDRGYAKWSQGKMSDSQFATNLSMEWAMLPRPDTGKSHYAGVGNNKALVSKADVFSSLDRERQYVQAGKAGVGAESGVYAKESGRVSKGMTDDQIITSLGGDSKAIKKSKSYRPGMFSDSVTDSNSTFAKIMDTPIGGGIMGFLDMPRALDQMLVRGERAVGLLDDSDVALSDMRKKVAEADYLQNIRGVQPGQEAGFDPSRLIGSMIAPGGAAGRGASLAKKAAVGAIGGATMAPVNDASSESDFWTRKAMNSLTGAVMAPALSAVMEKAVLPSINKGINAYRNVMDPVAGEIDQLGQRYGVPTTFGDVSGKGAKAEVMLENVPVGMAKFRSNQQVKAREAAEGLAASAKGKMMRQAWDGFHIVEREAARGNREAVNLLAELNALGGIGDWKNIKQTSGRLSLFLRKTEAEKLYDEASQIADNSGLRIKPTGLLDAANRIMQELKSDILPDTKTIKAVQQIIEEIGARGELEFGEAQRLRSRLGNLISDIKSGDKTLVGDYGSYALSQLRTAITSDLQDSAISSGVPDLIQKFNEANSFYQQMVVPFKDRTLAKALKDASPDEVFDMFIKRGDRAGRAKQFYNALDSKGRAAVRYGLIDNALRNAIDDNKGIFSPAKFKRYIQDRGAAAGVLFSGNARHELDGFVKLMAHVERAGQFAENPPTGNRAVQILLSGGALGMGGVKAVAAYGGALALKLLFTSPLGKRYLMSAARLDAASPAMARIYKRILDDMPKLAGSISAQQNTED